MAYTLDSPLLSLGQAAAYAIQAWVARHNAQAPSDFGSTLVSQCSQVGLNADLCAAQCIHETGWLTSDWFVHHNNPAGVGVTGQPGVGATFPTMEAGIHAYLAHLLTYCQGSGNPWKSDDPRYQAAMSAGVAGTVTTVGGLAGTWAVPGTGYGQALVSLANDLVASIGGSMPNGRDPEAEWSPSSNFDQGRNGQSVSHITDHLTAGTSSLSWLRGKAGGSSNMNSSATYLIERDGHIYQLVDENDTPWTDGNYNGSNLTAITIEHEAKDGEGFTDAQVAASIGLHVRIAQRHGWTQLTHPTASVVQPPYAAGTVLGHFQVPDPNDSTKGGGVDHHTNCPGSLFPFGHILSAVNAQLGGNTPATDTRYFPETQHHLSHGFKAYWEHFGGLPIFGFPISEEFDIGGGLTVQYFEKGARFEWHPGSGGNPPNPWDVMEGNTGAEALDSLKQRFPDAFKPVQP